MKRVLSEVLIREAVKATEAAEKGLDKAKELQLAEKLKSEAVYKSKEANKQAMSTQKTLKDAEAAYRKERDVADKTLQQVLLAKTPMAQDVSEEKFKLEKQRVTLVEAELMNAGEASTKAATTVIEMQENENKANLNMAQRTFEDEQRKATLMVRAEQAEKKAEGENCRVTPASVKMSNRWPMEGTPRDVLSNMHATAIGGAVTFSKAGVRLKDSQYLKTEQLNSDVGAKSLEVFLKLNNKLDQKSAGVISIQAEGGKQWDAIIFGSGNRRWGVSSNLGASAPEESVPEEKSANGIIGLLATWDTDGTIRMYRNGMLYRPAFNIGKLQTFEKNKGELLFGAEKGTGKAEGHFTGTILETRLYKKTLTADEAKTSYFAFTQCPSLQRDLTKNREGAEAQSKIASDAKLHFESLTNASKPLMQELKGKRESVLQDQKNRALQQQKDSTNFEQAGTNALAHIEDWRSKACRRPQKAPSPNAGKFSAPAFKYQLGWNFIDQWSFNSKRTLVADFNFDGRDDFARLGVNFMHLFISRGDGTFWQPVYKFPKGWNFERKKWATIGPIDLNGDYKADFIRTDSKHVFSFLSIGNNTDCWYRNGEIPHYCFGLTKFDFPGTWKFEGVWSLGNKKQTIIGDFNGDGKQDWARIGSIMIHYFISKGDGSFFVPIYPFLAGTNYGWDENVWTTLSGDFTGNCRTSILRASKSFLHSYIPDGTNIDCWHKDGMIKHSCMKKNAFVYPKTWVFENKWTLNSRGTLVGDINGDGRQDFVRVGPTQLDLFISRGDGTFYTPLYRFPPKWDFTFNEDQWTTLPAGDFDGDGKMDIIRATFRFNHGFYSRGDDQTCWKQNSYIPASCFLVTTYNYPGNWHFSDVWKWNQEFAVRVADVTGDGKQDVLHLGGGTFAQMFIAL